jgi:ferric-dicitrate binding protein FerR (iron transport regulator)
VGAILGTLILVGVLWIVGIRLRRRRKTRNSVEPTVGGADESSSGYNKPELEGSAAVADNETRRYELASDCSPVELDASTSVPLELDSERRVNTVEGGCGGRSYGHVNVGPSQGFQ